MSTTIFSPLFLMDKCHFEHHWPKTWHFHYPLFGTRSAIWGHRAQMQCLIVVKVNVNLPRLCIIATSGMAPALSPPTNNIHTYTHTEAEGTAKELITRAFNAKKATQILHFKNVQLILSNAPQKPQCSNLGFAYFTTAFRSFTPVWEARKKQWVVYMSNLCVSSA